MHNSVPREVQLIREVLFIRSGKVRLDLYDDYQNYLESRILLQGEIVLLTFGGHGFEMIEVREIIKDKLGASVEKFRFAGDVGLDSMRSLPDLRCWRPLLLFRHIYSER